MLTVYLRRFGRPRVPLHVFDDDDAVGAQKYAKEYQESSSEPCELDVEKTKGTVASRNAAILGQGKDGGTNVD